MINLPFKELKLGKNKVFINFVNLYRGGGEGIHSFIDPADKLQYVYTKFEPAACHYMFPVFDQPDMRAPWTFTAVYPKDWLMISNEYEVSVAFSEEKKQNISS